MGRADARALAEHGFGQFVVELPGEAPFIGVVGLNHVRWNLPFTPAVEVGWRLARPIGARATRTEAARAAIDDGFGRLGLDEIVAYTVPANRRFVAGHGAARHDPRPGRGFRPPEPSRKATRCAAMFSTACAEPRR